MTKMLKLIDTHAHLNLPEFEKDREAVFARAVAAGVGIINVGTDLTTSKLAVELAQNRKGVWATVGLHPTDWAENFKREDYLTLVQNEKTVAIGECGLDYFRADKSSAEKQKAIFIQQVELANELNKPLMLHIRDAYHDAFDVLKAHAKVRGNVHFFAGTWEEAKLFLDLGFTISFTGVITFAQDYDKVIKNTPLEMILTETDCPFVAPEPYRGKRNEPLYVQEVLKKLAEIKNLSYDEVALTTLANARRVFKLA